jgi:tetratricopeptide (TPR) repeat protein
MTLSIIAMAALSLAQAGAPLINVDAKDRDTIFGERKFRVTVQAQSPITQVEFYVGSDLRDSDTSTPYEFKLDTLEVDDGDLKLTFAAYTTDGKSTKKTVTVRVDNGVGKGADFHVQKGNDLLSQSKWDEAITSGRIALKAKKAYNPARVVLARAYMGKNVLDRAQKYAEDVIGDEPNNLGGLELLAAIKLQQAFITVNRGGSTADTQKTIAEALRGAADARRKSLDMQVDNFGAVNDDNRLRYVDLAITAGRYSIVPSQLSTVFARDMTNANVGNRIAFAQVKMGRWAEARATLGNLNKRSAMDAYSYALLAVIETEAGNRQASDDAMKEAILSDAEDLGVRTAQAYIALKNVNTGVLGKLASDLARDQGQRTEVNYFLSALTNRLADFEQSRKYFERAVLAEPSNADMYVERGNESVRIALKAGLDKKDADLQLNGAKILFETAIVGQPTSFQGLSALAMIHLMQGNVTEAIKFGEAAVAANPNYAAGHYALAAAFSEASKRADGSQKARLISESQKSNLKAGLLDKANLEGREIPNAPAVFRYFETGGRTLVMTPPK